MLDLSIVCPIRSTEEGLEFYVLGHWFPEHKINLFLNKRYVTATGCHYSTLPNIMHKEYKVLAFRLNGKKINAKAHRLAWELFVGPIGEGMKICHNCDNPPCVHPQHLFEGTTLDNNADRSSKGRSNRKSINTEPKGPEYPEYIPQIESLHNRGFSQTEIADRLGIHQSLVSIYLRKYIK